MGAAVSKETPYDTDAVDYYVTPTYKLGRKPWRLTQRMAKYHDWGIANQSERTISWHTGGQYQFRSADDPGDVVSETIYGIVIEDECGRMSDEFFDYVDPMCAVHDAFQYRPGTPRGKGTRFYRDFLRGLDIDGNSPLLTGKPPVDRSGRYISFRAPSWVSPLWTKDKVEVYRAGMSPAMFDQEIGAKFLDAAASLFGEFWDAVSTGVPEKPHPHGLYIIGADLAKHQDFTALRVFRIDEPGILAREVAQWRGNELSWQHQRHQIAGLSRLYNNALVVIDSTGLGEPVADELEAMGIMVYRFTFTPSTKQALIDNFIAKGQTRQIVLLSEEVDRTAYQEGTDFEYELVVPRGTTLVTNVIMKYGHAPGKHDDTVMGRALAVWGVSTDVLTGIPVS